MKTTAPSLKPIAITPGEPGGIGPDLICQISQQLSSPALKQAPLVIIADQDMLLQRAQALDLKLNIAPYQSDIPLSNDKLWVLHCPMAQAVIPGQANIANAQYLLHSLDLAIEGCQRGEFAAMVTGPINKSIINQAGIAFSGHTEYLQEKTQATKVVMMLATEDLRVALATTHLPLKDVAAAISKESLSLVIEVLQRDLINDFGIAQPRILVCGLNPHAGEDGHLGREEIEIITPVLDKYRQLGYQLIGPLPADTLFTEKHLKNADAALAMFHDQGLPVLKYAGFGRAANITLGLPIIRTSVDHGTAFDLAGSGQADCGSLLTAINCAAQMARARQQ